MAQPIILDLETKKVFHEVGGDHRKLGVSVVGIFDYATAQYRCFLEDELPVLFSLLENASQIIGFNIDKFDLPVLSPYYVGDIGKFQTLDLLEDIRVKLGFRLALDDLIRETLGVKKGGHGLLAVNYFREGRWDELKKYCLSDVENTKNLYEFGKRYGEVYYKDHRGRREIKVDWNRKVENIGGGVNLTLGF